MPSERIQLIIDLVTGQSTSRLGRLTADLKKTEGAFNKAKVAGSAIGDFLKQNLAFGAAAAGTAIVGFGIKSAKAFTDAGRAAGLLRDQTKLTAEEASRLAEVGSDIGIPVETLATAIGRMNRAAANTPEAFSAIGAELKRAKDGSLDVNETFLETIETIRKIPDAAERAEAAQKIFGRGWQQISELIMTGADGVRAALEGVSEAQVFSDEEIAKAREMHARLEDLQDQLLAFQLAVGEFSVDFVRGLGVINSAIGETVRQAKRLATLQDLRNALFGSDEIVGKVADDLGKLNQAVSEVQGPVALTAEELVKMAQGYRDAGVAADVINGKLVIGAAAMRDAAEATTDAGDAASDFESRVQDAGHAERRLKEEADAAAEAIRDLRAEVVQGLDNTHDYEEASLALADSLDDLTDKTDDYNEGIADGTLQGRDQAAALRDVREAQISAAKQALTTALAFADQSGAQEGSRRHTRLLKDELKRLADENPGIRGEVQKYIDKLNAIPKKQKTDAEFEADAATQAASDYDRRLSEIRTQINTTAHLAIGDAMSAANAFEERLNQIGNRVVTPRVQIGGPRASGGPVEQGVPYLVGEQGPEFFVPTGDGRIMSAGATRSIRSRARSNIAASATFGARADELREQARAKRELAKATADADEKERLLDEAQQLSDQSANQLEKSQARAAKASQILANAAGAEADRLRDVADALRERADAAIEAGLAQHEFLSEQSRSFREAFDAERALEDAQRSAADTAGELAAARKALAEANRKQTIDGVTTFVHAEEERVAAARAVEDALRAQEAAALAVADADVQAAKERKEAAGGRFAELDAIRAFRASLTRQGRGDLVSAINVDRMIALQRAAERAAERGEERAEDLRATAKNTDRAATAAEKQAAKFDRLTNGIERVLAAAVRKPDGLSEREVRRIIRRALDGV